MARPRGGQSERSSKPQLGESWVVESDQDGDYEPSSSPGSGDETPSQSSSTSSAYHRQNVQPKQEPEQSDTPTGRQRQKSLETAGTPRTWAAMQNSRGSMEPELIMPSIQGNNLNGPRARDEKPRRRKTTPQQGRETRYQRQEDKVEDPAPYDWLESIFEVILSFSKPIARWCYDVAGRTFNTLKTPAAYLIAGYLLIGLTSILRNMLTNSIYTALSPVCRIPGSSLLNLPMCKTTLPATYKGNEAPGVQFDELMTVQSKFEEVLEASAGGASLPLDMKRGETSIRDLRTVVRHSSLHSKNELVLEFDGFIETARIASWDLQRFNSHVGHSVDKVTATARWTRRVLEDISIRDASQGAISAFVNGKILAPFQPLPFTESALVDQYIQHSRTVEDEISVLVSEGQALLSVLLNMEKRLDLIHDIAVRDDIKAQGSKEEVLSELWTILGGNSKKLGKLDSQLKLLKQVNTYRQSALAHVSGTLVKLQAMSHDLEDLRERMGGVELVPLRVHIENIEMGVERLEQGRTRAKELEGDTMRRNLDQGQGKWIDGG